MMRPWRLLVVAAALYVTMGAGVAVAQTVIVRHAPPKAAIELALNSTAVGSATADAEGEATISLNLLATANKSETEAYIFVDVCDTRRRVVLAERGMELPPQGTCERREISGLFLLRQVTTLVIDVGASSPTVWIRQGPVDLRALSQIGLPRPPRALPVGLLLFGGGGFTSITNEVALACGNVADCAGDDSGFAYTAGVTVWITKFIGAEASYVKPSDVTARGNGGSYRFDSRLDAHVFTMVGKGGATAGPVRIYGHGGATYHRATLETTQTIDDSTLTIDGVAQTIKGATQTWQARTGGWGWTMGGGLEAWLNQSVALFGELDRAALKGAALDDGEAVLDDAMTSILFGVKVRLGRSGGLPARP